VVKSLVRTLEPPACGCLAGLVGGLIGGVMSCWPFAVFSAILGALIGLLCGIAANLFRNDRLWRASGYGFIGGMAVGFGLGVYCCLHAPL
jgi:hypothetical protein